MIPENIVEEIRHRADVTEVVGRFLLLKREGHRYKCCCPFHGERTPSFYVTPSMQRFKCFGCGEGGDAVTFLMKIKQLTYPDALRWLAGFYQISIEGESRGIYQPPQRRESRAAPTLPPSFTDPAIFQKTLSGYNLNNLVQWLCVKLGRAVVMDAVKEYQVGTTKGGATIFWQVNYEGKAGTGHVMAYPNDDHHRIKTTPPNWVHSLNGWSDANKYNWVKYWFGEYLLSKYPARTVAIVESEKTALVCSIYFERLNFVWIASCGKDGINSPEKWDVLKGRTVVLYPDLAPPDEKGRTPFQDWSHKAAELAKQGFNVSVNEFLETHADEFERGQKWDIGDFLLSRELHEFTTEHSYEQDNAAPMEQVYTNEPKAHRGQINTIGQPAASLEVLHLGSQRKQYRDPHTGQPYELIINADGYPAQWDLIPGKGNTGNTLNTVKTR